MIILYLYIKKDEQTFTDLEANENLRILNEFYKTALVYEFELTNRDNDYIMNFEDVIFHNLYYLVI